ncbi:hypothetical protein B0H10DRAFT_107168 [Mycena sp. CBHHK59/15]|nr:hypothetical protein B0H10DRAFT_107168 [Mycena sp. CBHHK59/15]
MGEFDQTIGVTLMGVMMNTLLMGVLMSQFVAYWVSTYKDPLWIRSSVVILVLVNVSHGATALYMAWFYCVANFNNPAVVPHSLWVYPYTALTTAVLAVMNQTFQSWRIYLFTRNKILVCGLLAASLVVFITGVIAGTQSWILSDLTKLHNLQPLVEGNLALQATLDVSISLILAYCLSKSKTTFKRTDMVLNRLIRGAVESGFFTSICALGELFSFRFAAGTYVIGLFALPIGRIYTHTMMDHLVRRDELRGLLSNGGNIISVPAFNTTNGGDPENIAMTTHNSSKVHTLPKIPEAC